jgi:chorismate mutase
MMADDLGKLRAKIDRIDGELLALIEARQSVAAQVAGTKPPGSPVFRPAREAYLLASLLDRAAPANSQLVKRVWRQLLSASVARQKPDFTVLAPQQLSLAASHLAAGFFKLALTDDSAAALARLAAGEGDLALLDADSLAGLAAEISESGPVRLIGRFEDLFLLSCLPTDADETGLAIWAVQQGDSFALVEQSGYLEGPSGAHLLGRIAADPASG